MLIVKSFNASTLETQKSSY